MGTSVQAAAAAAAPPPPALPPPSAPETIISAVPGAAMTPPSVTASPSIDLTVRRSASPTPMPMPVAVPGDEPAKAPRKTGLIVAVGLLLVAAVVAGVLLLGGGDDDKSSTGAPGTTAAPTATTTETGGATTVAPTTPPTTDDSAVQAEAAAQLSGFATESLSMLPDLADRFVVQLDRYRKGTEAEPVNSVENLRLYTEWRDKYLAILVDGGTIQFASAEAEQNPDVYFVFIPIAFDKRADAETWCQEQAVVKENCGIRKIKPSV